MSHHEHHQGHAHEPYEFAVHHSEEEGKIIRRTLWNVFWILLIVTTIEVLLGIFWKSWGFPWHIVKNTFIFMTILKAYYIVAYFMHLKDEARSFIYVIVMPYILFIIYLSYILIYEGYSLHFLDLWFK